MHLTPLISPNLSTGHKAPSAKTDQYLFSQLIPYLGNKRKLLGLIRDAIEVTSCFGGTFVDMFAGSGVVSRYAKQLGYQVIANDWEPYAFEINNCFIGCNKPPEFEMLGDAACALQTLNALKPEQGWVANHLCPADDLSPNVETERMFFTRANGSKIDAMRSRIESWDSQGLLSPTEKSYLLAPLLFASSYVSNTSGVFKGFHNGWGGKTRTALYRILSDIHLRTPVLWNGQTNCETWQLDSQIAAERLRSERKSVDIAYLDPPYNQHPYASNYHVLNSIALWDKTELSRNIEPGQKSAIRRDWRTERRSAYNSRSDATTAFGKLLETIPARWILISYSTDGIISLRDLIDMAASNGGVSCVLKPYKRYRVSTQRMSHKPMNVEFVLVVEKGAKSLGSSDMVYDQIMKSEQDAIETHRETAVSVC